MKTILSFVATVIAITMVRLPAQDADEGAQAKSYANAATPSGGFGDLAASRSYEMTSVTGELQDKLDSKSAKVGARVTLKTTDKVQISDGTVIPRGSHLVGHISELQAHNSDRAIAQMGIVFDRIELKNGSNVPIHTLIWSLRPLPTVSSMSPMMGDDSMSAATNGGRMGGAGGIGAGLGGRGGPIGAGGGLGTSVPGAADPGSLGGAASTGASRTGVPAAGPMDGAGGIGAGTGLGAGLPAGEGAREDSAVHLSGHGDTGAVDSAHVSAATRTVPHPTGIPGVMLAGSGTASGLFLNADRKDIKLESGTRFELGVVADQ